MVELRVIEEICENCEKFCLIGAKKATDVETNKLIPAGQRSCSAGNVAWADSPCTTGEFVKKETVKKV